MSAKTKNKCLFSDAWLSNSRFSEWLNGTHNKWQAYCSFVKKVLIYQTWALPVSPVMRQGKCRNSDLRKLKYWGNIFWLVQ